MASEPQHVVVIVGGAVSGSVAAEMLADKGVTVIVVEQNDRPYGKIEDGLPRWHSKQRRMEYEKINARLSKPNVHFVPRTKLGRDVPFLELAKGWGLSALLLANGAWRDRPLELSGVDQYVDRGLVYQNPFIYWFNHKNEKSYDGPRYEVPEGCLCVGGGLASIDVIKVIQLELYERALKKRGIEVDMYHLEHEGIPEVCKEHGINDPKELGVRDGYLIYRRRTEDMPLAQEPDNATPDQKKKTEATRKKILDKCREKFLFRFEDRRLPQKPVVEDGRMAGLVACETKVEGRKADPVPGTEREIRTDMTISSIGSVPEKIDGIAMKGEYYTYKNWDTGEYEGIPGVFGVGNVVTGQGNIRASFVHGQFVAKHLIENYLGIGESRDISAAQAPGVAKGAAGAASVEAHLQKVAKLPPEKAQEILGRVRALQKRVGFESDYKTWIAKNTPPDLE
jgi:NADPH-dependent glutamate synthase beta subunit-like oxidoreductase